MNVQSSNFDPNVKIFSPVTRNAEVKSGHYFNCIYEYDLVGAYYKYPCTNYAHDEYDTQISSPAQDSQSIPMSPADCKIAAMLTTVVAISFFLIKEIVSNTKNNTIEKSPLSVLRDLRVNNPNRIIIGQLNINSIRNKFEELTYIIENAIDIFLVSETKLNDTFPEGQFHINGFSRPYRLDRMDRGGGIILFIREHIHSKRVNLEFLPKIEGIAIEVNLKKEIGCYYVHIIPIKI